MKTLKVFSAAVSQLDLNFHVVYLMHPVNKSLYLIVEYRLVYNTELPLKL